MEALFSSEALLALFTLTAMEIVLGIDNIVFIAILVAKAPKEKQAKTRKIGLIFALLTRLGLLFSITLIMKLTTPIFTAFNHGFTGRDLVLLIGGLFLIAKSTNEIHAKVEGGHEDGILEDKRKKGSVGWIVFQIAVIDIVFSLDSVITAVGMANDISIMVIAMLISMGVMLISAKSISDFVEDHPSIKILALSFLLLIGVMLVAEGMGRHFEKGYIYFAMFFSLAIEILNMRYRKKSLKK